jgi:hypothetical protein
MSARSPRSHAYYYHELRHKQAKEIANRFAANGSIANVKNGIRLWEKEQKLTGSKYYVKNVDKIKLVLRYLRSHLKRLERSKHIFGVWYAEAMMRRLKRNFNSVRSP